MIQSNLFISEMYSFLNSVTIKNKYFADAAKAKEMARLRVSDLDDTDNPYYQNLVGDYSAIDTIMTIVSIDTEEEIEFTKENLELHPKTKHAYRIPGEYYSQLVTRYPQQVDLIKCILYPVTDIQAAIDAPNFTLLQYEPDLLEYQEVASIVNAITKHLTLWRNRWDVKEYTYEEYYPITQWAALWATLPTVILCQRVANLKTSSAHSTHIWEYLTSNGLGDYRSILSREQELFLYKNIQYLIQNRGKDSTLTILADNLLKPHNVTLRSKAIMLNTENSSDVSHPIAEIISRDIRDLRTPSQAGQRGYETVPSIIEREYANGLEPVYNEDVVARQASLMDHARQSWTPTKLVELNKIDLYMGQHNHYIRFAIETILYKQSRGELDYNITIQFTDSEISINLTASECLALIFYCIEREFNQKIYMEASNVDQHVGKTVITESGDVIEITEENKSEFIDSFVEVRSPIYIPQTAYVDFPFENEFPMIEEDFIWRGVKHKISHVLPMQYMMDRIPTNVGDIESPDGLLSLIDEQFKYLWLDHQVLWSNQDDTHHLAFDLLYSQLRHASQIELGIDVGGATTYTDWFDSNTSVNGVIETLESSLNVREAFARAGNDLILAMVPLHESSETQFTKFTTSDYLLMKQLFVQLCSYNIAFLDTERVALSYLRFTPTVLNDKPIIDYKGSPWIFNSDFGPKIEERRATTSIIEFRMGLHSTQVISHVTDLSNNIEMSQDHNVLNDIVNMVHINAETTDIDIDQ